MGSAQTWIVATSQGNKGPFSRAQIMDQLSVGQIRPDTYIWREGLGNWVLLSDSSDFGAAAPSEVAEPTPVLTLEPAPALTPDPTLAHAIESRDDVLDGRFIKLVKGSWDRHRRHQRVTEIDEVLVGAVITGTLDAGYALIDLTSDGTNHYLRFEEMETGNRVIFQLRYMATSLVTARVVGYEARVTIGYGERVRDFGKIMKSIRQELKGGYIKQADPGIITIDGDLSSQYVYVQIELIWDLADYLSDDDPYAVLYPKLGSDLEATIHALRKYLRGRFK